MMEASQFIDYVQISRFRFFMGEPRSWWCNDGQFEALAEGSA
jgi:hypothetical protein